MNDFSPDQSRFGNNPLLVQLFYFLQVDQNRALSFTFLLSSASTTPFDVPFIEPRSTASPIISAIIAVLSVSSCIIPRGISENRFDDGLMLSTFAAPPNCCTSA